MRESGRWELRLEKHSQTVPVSGTIDDWQCLCALTPALLPPWHLCWQQWVAGWKGAVLSMIQS